MGIRTGNLSVNQNLKFVELTLSLQVVEVLQELKYRFKFVDLTLGFQISEIL